MAKENNNQERISYYRDFIQRGKEVLGTTPEDTLEKLFGQRISHNLWIYSQIAREVYELSNKEINLENIEDYSNRLFILIDTMKIYDQEISRGEIPNHYADLIESLKDELEKSRGKIKNIINKFDNIKSESLLEVAA